ncbi:MAG TPA: response regulator transcription factor [Acidimicrobiales bacterium]|jgi:DNA-binding response OmpR family regulator|nr:response regulator transcription factor [Acidimicrobiales bacterium]
MQILIVEDEEHLASALQRGLEKEGFGVDVASSGDEGLRRARESAYDLILLDILLPGVNGYQICLSLRQDGNWVPILMLTAKDGEYDEAEALDSGADDFLSKPFSFVVLLARIRALLRRGRRERPTILTAGDLTLDPAEHRCRRGEEPIELTPREFSLLEYLMRFPGEAVSKQEILLHVWGDEFDGDPNIVEVYVGYIRKKIDHAFGREAIETVRGIGYRLNAQGG